MKTSNIPKVEMFYPDSNIIRINAFYIPHSSNTHDLELHCGWNLTGLSTGSALLFLELEELRRKGATAVTLIIQEKSGSICTPEFLIRELQPKITN